MRQKETSQSSVPEKHHRRTGRSTGIRYDNLEISAIRSGKGDCIHLRFGSIYKKNIIIDTGPTSTSGEFRKLYQIIINSGERVDGLFITHYDDDHIGGILKLVQTEQDLMIDAVYFNAYQQGQIPTSNLSAIQNQRLFHSLIPKIVHTPILAGQTIGIGEAEIRIISPTPALLSNVVDKMQEAEERIPLASVSGWNKTFEELTDYDYPTEDSSIANQASIVMAFEYEGMRMLLCGDAPASCILQGLPDQTYFDIVKLPHHGSARNISDELLHRISADAFLICADGTSHPNKLTIAKLLNSHNSVRILGNYSWWGNGFFQMPADQKYLTRLEFKNIT